jgi:hypothetical protein
MTSSRQVSEVVSHRLRLREANRAFTFATHLALCFAIRSHSDGKTCCRRNQLETARIRRPGAPVRVSLIGFEPRHTRVILVERGPRILATFDESLSARAQRDLESLGIEVRTGASVTDATEA